MLKLFQLLNRITYLRVRHKIDAEEHSGPKVVVWKEINIYE